MPDLTTSAAVRYRDTYLTVGNIHSAGAWDAANDGLAAIEAEAVAAERARITAAVLVAGMFEGCGGMGCTEERNDELAAVLAIVNPEAAR